MNDILLIDKESGWTSNDVVTVLKKKLNPNPKKKLGQNEKKFRIGHAGTLDPFATGLLLIMIGDATKKFSELQNLKKEYIAEIEFGKETDTYDIDGVATTQSLEFLNGFNGGSPSLLEGTWGEASLTKILGKNFSGKILQTPPIYSALKVNGKRAYDLAREGKEIKNWEESKKREVEIYEWEILNLDKNILKARFVVSSGTYIRSIAYDLGKLTGYGAYLKTLRRTKIGDYAVGNATKI